MARGSIDRREAFRIGTAAAVLSMGDAGAATRPAPVAARRDRVERPDGASLFVRDWGSGEPVMFVHGAAISAEIWNHQLRVFHLAGFRCVAFDRRGHGRSNVPATGYDYDTLADDLAGVIDALDLRDVTLVGHSMGCGEIVRYLTRHGAARVRKIALLAPTLPFLLKSPDNPHGIERALVDDLHAEWLRDYPGWAAQNARAFFAPETSEAMLQWGVALATRTDLHVTLETGRTTVEADFRAELARITVPTLLLHGAKDASCPLELTGGPTAQRIPGAKLVVYDDAAHGLMITHADRVNDDLLAFIRRG